jgi:hypothetical protein
MVRGWPSKESQQRKVKIHDVTGGREIEIFNAPEIGALRWSPDGSELMFWARGHGSAAQYIAPVSGGPARKIAAGFFVGCWSPDGSTIALGLFVTGKILFLNRVGDVQRTIALKGTSGEWMSDLDWSRVHGRLLIVADDKRRVPSIWTIRSDGSEQAKVFSGESEILAARAAGSRPVASGYRQLARNAGQRDAQSDRAHTVPDWLVPGRPLRHRRERQAGRLPRPHGCLRGNHY